MTRDYIPSSASDFNSFQENLNEEVTANATAWNVPAPEVTALNTWSAGYEPKYNAIVNKNSRTREQVVAHDQYKSDFVAFLRPFCQSFLTNNLLIPVSERVALGLNPRGLNPPSERPAILSAPIPSMKPLGGGMVQFGFKVADSTSRGRHPESNGVEVYYRLEPVNVGPQPINDSLVEEEVSGTTGNEIPFEKAFNTRARFVSEMGLQNIGMRLNIYARWVNTSNPVKNGPYSSIISMVIS